MPQTSADGWGSYSRRVKPQLAFSSDRNDCQTAPGISVESLASLVSFKQGAVWSLSPCWNFTKSMACNIFFIFKFYGFWCPGERPEVSTMHFLCLSFMSKGDNFSKARQLWVLWKDGIGVVKCYSWVGCLIPYFHYSYQRQWWCNDFGTLWWSCPFIGDAYTSCCCKG